MAARRVDLLEAHAQALVQEGCIAPKIIEVDLYPVNAAQVLAEQAANALGRVDILINSAGGSRPIPFEASREVWEEAMTLNFGRLRELTHAIVPGMKARGFGHIVNMRFRELLKR